MGSCYSAYRRRSQYGHPFLITLGLASWIAAIAYFLLIILILAGWIAVLIAYFKASDELGEPEIKNNTLRAIIAGIVGIILFMIGGGTMMLTMISEMREGGGMHFGGTGF